MAKIKSNDFDTLFKEYNSYVFKIVINESGNKLSKQDIEETVSDIFFLLWKSYYKIKDNRKVKSYIGKIAKNTTKNKLRSIKKELSYDGGILSSIRGTNDSYYVTEQLKIVHKTLQNMDEIDKKLFIMFYYENKKIKEIAKMENINSSTIKTRLHRIRKKLKKVLEKRGFKYER